MREPFSLLLPVYHGDDPGHLRRAFASTVNDQLCRPDEVVVVEDGQLTPGLGSTIEALAATSPVPVRRLSLSRHVGLAQALQCGLSVCSHEVIARMDADDVSLPHRFSVQLPLIESGADLVGAGLVEFADDESGPGRLRVPPIGAEKIATSARLRSPFNHPTVVYRRSAVLQAGGYQFLPLLEDYWLFTRMIAAGATVANVAEPLVMYRVGSGAYDRRGGLRLLRSEIGLQRRLRREDFTTTRQMVRNLAVRGGYRLTPVQLRRLAYRRVFTSRNAVPSLDSLPTLHHPARPTSLPRP